MFLSSLQPFNISYVSGQWTVDYHNLPYTGPEGLNPSLDAPLTTGCKVDTDVPYGYLLGYVGGGSIFRVGREWNNNSNAEGELFLGINDDDPCLADIDGSVTINISVGTAKPSSPPPPPSSSSLPIGDLLNTGKCHKSRKCGIGHFCKKKRGKDHGRCALNQSAINRLIEDAICWGLLGLGLTGEFVQCVLDAVGHDECTGLTQAECAVHLCDKYPDQCHVA